MKFLALVITLSVFLMNTAGAAATYTPPKKGGPGSSSGSGTRFTLEVDRFSIAFWDRFCTNAFEQ
ncbi:MAG TPA: hypothetical protein IGS53_02305 [Leptolyngbyaceae cyanobacterium M33_DOE_097]|uniref:Uncharacterized protein n=1 Tax=Oscillatoriales cyanobacterium SpSt-418 TaxID=2282169 RepID=A0A7C3KEB5_9CYAN|nr:hypothetical protein [Leptolyngbyaceae cyanobacterium M33_DOE_097]